MSTLPLPAASPTAPGVRLVALVCLAGAALLVPWVVYLSASLPQTYLLSDWNAAWVGFDLMLMALLAVTGVLARRQDPRQGAAAYLCAAFLLADAWFDVMTSTGSGRVGAASAAILVELPLAVFLLRFGSRTLTPPSTLDANARDLQ